MPDANPKYKDLPRESSIVFFEESLKNHKIVASYNKIKEQQYKIIRPGKSDLYVYLTNLYIVSLADTHELINKFPSLNCIVTICSYNSYSNKAKSFCIENKIGLFRHSEFYGALHYDNNKFINYNPETRDKQRINSKY